MAEITGLALGVLSLAGTFKSCVDMFSYFSSHRSMGRDYEILDTKLSIEKALLLHWAERARLLQPDYDRRLDNQHTLKAVSLILAGIKELFGETSTIQERYGLRLDPESPSLPSEEVVRSRATTISRKRMEKFTSDFNKLQIRMNQRQQSVSTASKIRWAIVDKDKFGNLVQELSHFVTRLNQAIPPSSDRYEESVGVSMAREDVARIRDIRTLRLICDATSGFEPDVAEAAEDRITEIREDTILHLLWFRTMDDRKDGVSEAHSTTFEWALRPPHDDVKWDSLSGWLREGSGIYWLCGKAGSGKSTLMKFLLRHHMTRELLSRWAESGPLSLGSFFFWNLGNVEQKSQDGLSRAVLFQILTAEPSLIPTVLPRLWRQSLMEGLEEKLEPLTKAELKASFELIFHQTELSRHFCFFIDGLDEYEGDVFDAIAFVKNACKNPRIKILLSSRPEPLCVDAFKSMPKLALQDLTRPDISKYVHDIVGSHPYMMTLRESDPEDSATIITALIDKADGVFLWVVLACRSMIRGFASCDGVQDLCRRVDKLPSQLEKLFQHMLAKIEPRYHQDLVTILKICYEGQVSNPWGKPTVSTIGLAILDTFKADFRRDVSLKTYSSTQKVALCTQLEGRLRSRCGGLVEVCQSQFSTEELELRTNDPLIDSRVEFMHRTVFEFLSTPGVWKLDCLRHEPPPGFHPYAALAYMALQVTLSRNQRGQNVYDFFPHAVFCARRVDEAMPDISLRLLSAFGQLADALAPEKKARREQYGPQYTALLLSVETGLVNCTRHYLPFLDRTILEFPLLYHAIRKPYFLRFFPANYRLTSLETIQYLLSQGCRPNEWFVNFEELRTTPWRDFMRELERIDPLGVVQSAGMIRECLLAGADPRPVTLKPLEAIIRMAMDCFVNGSLLSLDEWLLRIMKEIIVIIKRMETTGSAEENSGRRSLEIASPPVPDDCGRRDKRGVTFSDDESDGSGGALTFKRRRIQDEANQEMT